MYTVSGAAFNCHLDTLGPFTASSKVALLFEYPGRMVIVQYNCLEIVDAHIRCESDDQFMLTWWWIQNGRICWFQCGPTGWLFRDAGFYVLHPETWTPSWILGILA